MTLLIEIGIGIIVILVIGYIYTVIIGYDNFRGITLQLDEMYYDIGEMTCAVFAELKKQGRECEVIEMGSGNPKFLIDGKTYRMNSKMASMGGVPMQAIQLKLCK